MLAVVVFTTSAESRLHSNTQIALQQFFTTAYQICHMQPSLPTLFNQATTLHITAKPIQGPPVNNLVHQSHTGTCRLLAVYTLAATNHDSMQCKSWTLLLLCPYQSSLCI